MNHFCTEIWALVGVAKSALGTTAVTCVLLTTVTVRDVWLPGADHIARVRVSCGEPVCRRSRFVPVMIIVRSALPALAVVGESELMVIDLVEGVGVGDGDECCGGTAESPPPQPERVATNITTENRIAAKRNILPRFLFTFMHAVPIQLTRSHL